METVINALNTAAAKYKKGNVTHRLNSDLEQRVLGVADNPKGAVLVDGVTSLQWAYLMLEYGESNLQKLAEFDNIVTDIGNEFIPLGYGGIAATTNYHLITRCPRRLDRIAYKDDYISLVPLALSRRVMRDLKQLCRIRTAVGDAVLDKWLSDTTRLPDNPKVPWHHYRFHTTLFIIVHGYFIEVLTNDNNH